MANKTKTRFNGIDLLIVIIIIGALAGIIMRYQLIDIIKSSDSEQTASISFYVKNIKSTSEQFINEGDVFYISNTNEKLGVLQSRLFQPAEEINETADGKFVISNSVSGRSDVVNGLILAEGDFTDEGFLLGGTKYIAPGSELTVCSQNIEFIMLITDIVKQS